MLPEQKDLQILLLRQQLLILQRQHPVAPSISRWQKLALAVRAAKLTRFGQGTKVKLDDVLLLFKPDTVLRWHRDLVRASGPSGSDGLAVGQPPTTICKRCCYDWLKRTVL